MLIIGFNVNNLANNLKFNINMLYCIRIIKSGIRF